MAKKKQIKAISNATIVETDDRLPPLAESLRNQIEDQFTRRESLRITLLNTLRASARDLNEAVTYGTVREALAFAQLADDGPAYAEVLRHIAELIDFASERINEAVMLRSDAVELFERSKVHLRNGLS